MRIGWCDVWGRTAPVISYLCVVTCCAHKHQTKMMNEHFCPIFTLYCAPYTQHKGHTDLFSAVVNHSKKKIQLQDCVTVSLYVFRFTSPQGTIVCIVCVHSLLIMSDIHNSRKDNWHAWRGCLNCPHGSKCVPTQTGMCSSDALVILMYKLYNWLLCCMIECNCLVMHVQLRQPCIDFLYPPQIVVLVELIYKSNCVCLPASCLPPCYITVGGKHTFHDLSILGKTTV